MVIIKYWLYSLCCTVCPCSLYILPFLNLPTLDIIAFSLESGWVRTLTHSPLPTVHFLPHCYLPILPVWLGSTFYLNLKSMVTWLWLVYGQAKYSTTVVFFFGGVFILFCFPRVNVAPLLLFSCRIFFLHNLHFFFISNLYTSIPVFFF